MKNRPQTLAEVAERADALETFGPEFQDWLHTIRSTHNRASIQRAIATEPQILRGRFPGGDVADAWLAAYAEYVATSAKIQAPNWASDASRVSSEPWFSVDSPKERELALRDSPPAFRNRNLFTPRIDLPLRLIAGRPPK
ncbi:MAG TPA: hypothetical protein VMM36_08115, partial [Opitutaceae bacterium]|nr:hypothetical protein [Opitutaceae bacterium]